jgi:hypothetical protein
MNDEPEFLDANQAAGVLGIFPTTLEALAERGIIPPGVRVTQRQVRWSRRTIEALKVLLPWLLESRQLRRKRREEQSAGRDRAVKASSPRPPG